MLATAGEAAAALRDLRAAHAGRVALGASQTVGTYLMPRLLAAFRSRNPGIEVTLQVERSLESAHGLHVRKRRLSRVSLHFSVECHAGAGAEIVQ